jgi:Dna[CI] antecedent DciA-like protein
VALTRAGAPDTAARLFGGAPERVRALMRAAWPLAVGPELSRRTEVLGVERGTLRVRVPDARWRIVLHGMQPDILRRLREIAGSLAPFRIGFVEGGMKDADPLPPPGPPREPADLPPEVVDRAAEIDDDEIRERFLATAARSLARKQPS